MWSRCSAWNMLTRLRGVPVAPEKTTSPGTYVLLFDGHCRFCQAQVKNLLSLARPGAIRPVDFQQPESLTGFPGITRDACMRAMQLVAPQGQVFQGFEAAARAVATRPVLGKLAYLYYVPGIRLSCDLGYALVARYRYYLLGKAVAAGGCGEGSCALHLKK